MIEKFIDDMDELKKFLHPILREITYLGEMSKLDVSKYSSSTIESLTWLNFAVWFSHTNVNSRIRVYYKGTKVCELTMRDSFDKKINSFANGYIEELQNKIREDFRLNYMKKEG